MKKVLALLLIAIIGLFAFVACNPDSSLNEELVNVTITSRDTRSLSVEAGFDLKDVTTWKYTAEKADNGLKTGATATEVELKDGKTQQLSQGSWNFEIYGYNINGNLICVGKAPNTTITVEKHTITILVGPQQTETGRGKIFIDSNISIADKDGKLFTDTKNVYTKIVTVKDSSENKVEESRFNSVKSGMYSVTVEYKAKDKDNNEYVAAFAKKYFNVYDNLTTTISGTVEETTQSGEANPEAEKVVASVGGKIYTSIVEALEAASSNESVILNSNASLNYINLNPDKNILIDLNDYTLTVNSVLLPESKNEYGYKVEIKNGYIDGVGNSSAFTLKTGSTLILDNVKAEYKTIGPKAFVYLYEGSNPATLKVKNSSLMNKGAYAIGTNAAKSKETTVNVTIENSTIITETESDDQDNTAILFNVPGELKITNSTISGQRQGVIVRGGTATISNSTIVSSGDKTSGYDYSDDSWGIGNRVPLAALVIGNRDTAGYPNEVTVNLDNVKLSTPNDNSKRKLMYVYQSKKDHNVTVSGTISELLSDESINDLYDPEAKENERVVFNDASSIKSLGLFNLAANRVNTAGKTVAINLCDESFKDINYSQNNSGYTGKGLLIGNTSLNWYEAGPVTNNDDKFTLILKGGSITSSSTGYSSIDGFADTSVYMLLPNGNTSVIFENVVFNNVISFGWQKYSSPWSNLNSLTLKDCTFDGIIVGTVPSENVTIDSCTFYNYTNTTSANNSNPIWWRVDEEGNSDNFLPMVDFEFTNNKVTSTRPVKIERVGRRDNSKEYTPVFKFLDNTFDISSQTGDTETKNMAINIGQGEKADEVVNNIGRYIHLYDDGNKISSNTASLYTASRSGGSNWYKDVSGTKIMDRDGNDKTITAFVWKTKSNETFEMKSVN